MLGLCRTLLRTAWYNLEGVPSSRETLNTLTTRVDKAVETSKTTPAQAPQTAQDLQQYEDQLYGDLKSLGSQKLLPKGTKAVFDQMQGALDRIEEGLAKNPPAVKPEDLKIFKENAAILKEILKTGKLPTSGQVKTEPAPQKKIDPDYQARWIDRALDSKDYGKAAGLAQELIDHYRQNVPDLEKNPEGYNDYANALQALAKAKAGQGQIKEAVAALDEVDKNKLPPDRQQSLDYQKFRVLATALKTELQKGNSEKATEYAGLLFQAMKGTDQQGKFMMRAYLGGGSEKDMLLVHQGLVAMAEDALKKSSQTADKKAQLELTLQAIDAYALAKDVDPVAKWKAEPALKQLYGEVGTLATEALTSGNYNEAVAITQKLMQSVDAQASNKYSNPDNIQTYANAASVSALAKLAQGAPDEALAALEKIDTSQLAPELKQQVEGLKVQILSTRYDLEMKAGNYGKAAETARTLQATIQSTFPDQPQALTQARLQTAHAALLGGDTKLAEETLKEVKPENLNSLELKAFDGAMRQMLALRQEGKPDANKSIEHVQQSWSLFTEKLDQEKQYAADTKKLTGKGYELIFKNQPQSLEEFRAKPALIDAQIAATKARIADIEQRRADALKDVGIKSVEELTPERLEKLKQADPYKLSEALLVLDKTGAQIKELQAVVADLQKYKEHIELETNTLTANRTRVVEQYNSLLASMGSDIRFAGIEDKDFQKTFTELQKQLGISGDIRQPETLMAIDQGMKQRAMIVTVLTNQFGYSVDDLKKKGIDLSEKGQQQAITSLRQELGLKNEPPGKLNPAEEKEFQAILNGESLAKPQSPLLKAMVDHQQKAALFSMHDIANVEWVIRNATKSGTLTADQLLDAARTGKIRTDDGREITLHKEHRDSIFKLFGPDKDGRVVPNPFFKMIETSAAGFGSKADGRLSLDDCTEFRKYLGATTGSQLPVQEFSDQRFWAKELNSALESGDKERVLGILQNMDQTKLRDLAIAYEAMTGKDLGKGLREHLSGKDLVEAIHYLTRPGIEEQVLQLANIKSGIDFLTGIDPDTKQPHTEQDLEIAFEGRDPALTREAKKLFNQFRNETDPQKREYLAGQFIQVYGIRTAQSRFHDTLDLTGIQEEVIKLQDDAMAVYGQYMKAKDPAQKQKLADAYLEKAARLQDAIALRDKKDLVALDESIKTLDTAIKTCKVVKAVGIMAAGTAASMYTFGLASKPMMAWGLSVLAGTVTTTVLGTTLDAISEKKFSLSESAWKHFKSGLVTSFGAATGLGLAAKLKTMAEGSKFLAQNEAFAQFLAGGTTAATTDTLGRYLQGEKLSWDRVGHQFLTGGLMQTMGLKMGDNMLANMFANTASATISEYAWQSYSGEKVDLEHIALTTFIFSAGKPGLPMPKTKAPLKPQPEPTVQKPSTQEPIAQKPVSEQPVKPEATVKVPQQKKPEVVEPQQQKPEVVEPQIKKEEPQVKKEEPTTKPLDPNDPVVKMADEAVAKLGGEVSKLKENPLRQEYENAVKDLSKLEAKMRAEGKSELDIAKALHQARRDLGVKYKHLTPEPLREYIYDVNQQRYGDPLGPSFDYLMKKYNGNVSEIIKASQRPNPDVGKLLAGYRDWLVGKGESYMRDKGLVSTEKETTKPVETSQAALQQADNIVRDVGPTVNKSWADYQKKVGELNKMEAKLRKEGKSELEIAKAVYQERQKLKAEFMDSSPAGQYLRELSQKKYGDPLGLSFDDMLKKYKGNLGELIKATQKAPAGNVDQFLAGYKEWLAPKGEAALKQLHADITAARQLREKIAGNVDKLKENPLRQEYENAVKDLSKLEAKMRAEGKPDLEIAKALHQARRELGLKYKHLTPEPLREYIYDVNTKRYGDPLGPSFDFLIKKYAGDPKKIIEASQRPNEDVGKLLANFEGWLTDKGEKHVKEKFGEFLK